MEAVLMGTANWLASVADKRKERRRLSSRVVVQQAVLIRVLKFLLHLAGFGAFVWSMFQVHFVAGGLAVTLSCFALSWLVGSSTPPVAPKADPGLRG
jgi:hypothetical protein